MNSKIRKITLLFFILFFVFLIYFILKIEKPKNNENIITNKEFIKDSLYKDYLHNLDSITIKLNN